MLLPFVAPTVRTRSALLLVATATFALNSTAHADIISDWNAVGSQLVAAAGAATGTGANGFTRVLAIQNLAVYDAVNSISGTYTPNAARIPVTAPASLDAAVISASYQSLLPLLPAAQQTALTARYNADLAAIPDSPQKSAGVSLGQSAASNLLAARTNDGTPGNSASPFLGGTSVGQWRPTPAVYGPTNATFAPFNNTAGANATWSSVKPFALPVSWQSSPAFQAPLPPAVGSPQYNASLANTQSLGSATSTLRTADQTQIAEFWYPASTITWNDITRTVVQGKNLSPEAAARVYALVNLALADSRIVAWNAKFNSGFDDGAGLWRPITAIRDASNPNQDPNWTPLLPTPNHPSYVSGHGVSGGAAAQVLIDLFGDNTPFSVSSPSTWLPTPGVTRSFDSFSQAAAENNASRIYAGIHFDFDQSAAQALGESVGRYVTLNALAPAVVPEPQALACLVPATALLLHRRKR